MSAKKDDGSLLMKTVEAIAIEPQEARALAERYESQIRITDPDIQEREIIDLISEKIINRYAKMAAVSGGATSLSGVIPGVGTVAAMLGGGAVDMSVCMKLQIDMTMCLCMAINKEMTNEDAKHMSFIIALAGTIEQAASTQGAAFAAKSASKVVENTLKGATLTTVKELFKQVGITFTKKALQRAIPFGIGAAIGTAANYGLTTFVGKIAKDILWIEHEKLKSSTVT